MLIAQRHRVILERLRLDGQVSVSELARDLGTSEITVRRDLNALHGAGLLSRVHGGAVSHGMLPLERSLPPAIGIVVPGRGDYFGEIVRGAESAAGVDGARLVLGVSGQHDLGRHQIARMQDAGVQGLLLTTGSSEAAQIASWFSEITLPTVLIEQPFGYADVPRPLDHVRTDHSYGAATAFRHLHELGHDRLAAVLLETPTCPWLEVGCRQAECQLGLDEPMDVLRIALDPSGNYTPVLEAFLDRELGRGVRGFLLHDGQLAAAFAALVLGRGMSVPDDIAIVAYNDVSANRGIVPLTAVAPPARHLGAAALAQLLRRINGPADQPVVHQALLPTLTVRESSGGMTDDERSRRGA